MSFRKKNKVLLVLSVPPPFGGGEILAMHLQQHLEDDENYLILATKRKKSNKASQGKITFSNLINGVALAFQVLLKIIKYRPKKLYLLVPKEFSAFLRTILIIEIASFFKTSIYGELAGNSFVFLEKAGMKRKIGLYYLRKISELRVLGESIKNRLEKENICKLVVIENGVYVPENINPVILNKKLKLLYVGAINYSKGIKNLLKSLQILQNQKIPVNLHIMGEWSNEKEQEEMMLYLQKEHLNGLVTFHGLVTTDEKWLLYKSSSLLIHPTFWDGQPLVILEAMGCALPVISTYVGAIPDTMRDGYNGTLLKENTAEAIAEAVIYYYKNPHILTNFSYNNRDTYLKKYSLPSYLLRMKDWLEKN